MPPTPQTLILPRTLTVSMSRYSRGQLWKVPIGKQLEELTEILLLASWFVTVIAFLLLIWSARFLIWSANGGYWIALKIISSALSLPNILRARRQAILKSYRRWTRHLGYVTSTHHSLVMNVSMMFWRSRVTSDLSRFQRNASTKL